MRITKIFLLLLMPFLTNAQGEFMNNSTNIPPARTGIGSTPAPSVFTPNVFAPKTEKKAAASRTIEEEKPEFLQHNDFMNPGDIYKDKLNKKSGGENMKVFRQNQYLGEIKTSSEAAKIVYRDFGEVDGDRIRIWVNGKIAISEIYLDGEFKGIDLALTKGFNKIDFEALNQGMVGPNTAQFKVFDDKGQIISSNQWNLATGFKATIMVIKE